MKNLIKVFALSFIAFSSTWSMAQSDAKEMAYQAYLTTNKSLWKELVVKMQSNFDQQKSLENRYQLVLAQHGLLQSTMVDQDEDLFDDYFKKTKSHLDELIDEEHEEGNARAILSAVYGWEMGYSSWKGMFLGGKSSSNIEKATKVDPTSPLVWQVYGSSKLFTPAAFGGSVQEAVKAYEKSVELYEANPGLKKSNWHYLDAMAWLGQAYEKNGQLSQAKAIYEKALEVEPGFGWVKFRLLPAVTKNDL